MFDWNVFTMTLSVPLLPETGSRTGVTQICLPIVGLYLPINERVLGLKYKYGPINVIKGQYCTTSYKKSKAKDETKINKVSFYNQVSIIVSVAPSRQVNVKLFGNGKLQITGCKRKEDATAAATVLLAELNAMANRSADVSVDSNGPIVEAGGLVYSSSFPRRIIGYREGASEYVIHKKHCVFDGVRKCFVTCKYYGCRTRLLYDCDGNLIGTQKLELLKNKKKFYNKNSKVIIADDIVYYDDNVVIGKVVYEYETPAVSSSGAQTDAPGTIFQLSTSPFLYESGLPVIGTLDATYSVADVETFSIMVNLNVGFKVNRQKLYQLLLRSGYISKFKPETYSGLYVLFKISTMDQAMAHATAEPHLLSTGSPTGSPTGICECNCKCTCTNVSVIVFQSGNVICAGFKTEEQIRATVGSLYHFLNANVNDIKKKDIAV